MKILQKALLVVVALGLLVVLGCKQPLDLSMQRNRIFLMGRLLMGQTCNVRVIWRKAPNDPVPVKVTADLSEIGGDFEQELAATDNGTWRWSGQVTPEAPGERLIIIAAVDSQDKTKKVRKRFRVFNTEKAIAIDYGGSECVLALKADGTLTAWIDYNGSRVETPAGLTNITAIASGGFHSLALKADGLVVAWGCDKNAEFDLGQCDVPEGLTDVVAIAAGATHSLALKAGGKVVAWGGISWSHIPMSVPDGLTDVVAIDARGDRCAAVKADGTVVRWPNSYIGEPAVKLDNVVAVSVGYVLDLVLLADGFVGGVYDNAEKATIPIRVGRRNAIAIDAGDYQWTALHQDGSVVVWTSSAAFGQFFGHLVFHRLNNIIAVASGSSRMYAALTDDGSVIVWFEEWTKNQLEAYPVPVELQ